MDPAADTQSTPMVLSANVGQPRDVQWHSRTVTTAIWKTPVTGPVALEGVNLRGDDQADRRVHGGIDKAVYAYALEDYEWWSSGYRPLAPGTFGDNLTTIGIELTGCDIGDRWHVGSTVLEVAQPRTPCLKLGIRMSDDGFTDAFKEAGRLGPYLRIITGGTLQAGDEIMIKPVRQPATSISVLATGELDDAGLRRVIDDPRIPDGWRKAARRALKPLTP